MTQPIRVVVANRPRLMRELVLETIGEQPDIEIVAEIQNEDEIVGIVDVTRPDVLIVTLDDSDRRPPCVGRERSARIQPASKPQTSSTSPSISSAFCSAWSATPISFASKTLRPSLRSAHAPA